MADQQFTKGGRIRELNSINADIPAMLQSAGQAINALTNRSLILPEEGDENVQMADDTAVGVEERKEAFGDATREYYTYLQAIVVRLKRQVYALEEAGIIAEHKPTAADAASKVAVDTATGGGVPDKGGPKAGTRIWNGGLGDLDVGWMNSRTNKVGAEKEHELMEEARQLVQDELKRREESKGK